MKNSVVAAALMGASLLSYAPIASAQFAVIDVGAIANLVIQVTTMRDQLLTTRDHLRQAQAEFASMTGGRGMERLLVGAVRNYLPPDWQELERVLSDRSVAFGDLSRSLQAIVAANAVLSNAELARLPASQRQVLESTRRNAALMQSIARDALAKTSERFASIQSLIDAIPRASDPKAIMDLQARMAAEQSMLTNEQNKLQLLTQTLASEREAQAQQRQERAIRDIGSLRNLPPMGL